MPLALVCGISTAVLSDSFVNLQSIAVTSTSTNGLGDPTNFEGGANGVVAEQPAVSTSTTTSTSVSAAVTPRRGVGRGKARGKMSQSNSRHQQQLTSVSRCEECGLEFYIQPPFQPSSWCVNIYIDSAIAIHKLMWPLD